VALDRADGPVDVGDGLALGDLADEHLAVLAERDDRRGGPATLGVRDDGRLSALEDGDGRVGGAQVDSDRTCHGDSPVVLGDGAGSVGSGLRLPTLPGGVLVVKTRLRKVAYIRLNSEYARDVPPQAGRIASEPHPGAADCVAALVSPSRHSGRFGTRFDTRFDGVG
jgi:hypothetical protein